MIKIIAVVMLGALVGGCFARPRTNVRPLVSSGSSMICLCGTITSDISTQKVKICREPGKDLSISGLITAIDMHLCTTEERGVRPRGTSSAKSSA